MTVQMSAPELSATDIATARGWSRTTAWRWLCQLEKQFGPTVVARRGRRLFTTAAALARVAPTLGFERLRTRVDDHEQRIEQLEARVDRLARDI